MASADGNTPATATPVIQLTDWLLQQGIEGTQYDALIEGFCERLWAAGVSVLRVNLTLRTHHPEFGTMAFRWHREDGTEREEYARGGTPGAGWLASPLYYLLKSDISELRQRLDDPDPLHDYPLFAELRARGATDYVATKVSFLKQTGTLAVDPMNVPQGMIISFTGDGPNGFSDDDMNFIRAQMPALSLALKSWANRQMAEDIAATYLGKDAGNRVVSGDIIRGSSETISAVIWYFDLQGFTKLSESLPGPAVLELLNDYFGSVVQIVEELGGNVLKFMGDGMLAIFSFSDVEDANAAAVEAAARVKAQVIEVNARRNAEGLPATGFSLAMHAGDVLYGNIGSKDRLDFTVIGPAVNTTARMLGMCSLVDQNIIISSNVASAVAARRDDIVSLGQYRLRGVTARQELFTLD